MDENNTLLSSLVMRRIYIIYWYRRLTKPTALKFSGLVVLSSLGLMVISVRNVWANLSHLQSFGDICQYLFNSFTKTQFGVQTIIVTGLIFIMIIAKDVASGMLYWWHVPKVAGYSQS